MKMSAGFLLLLIVLCLKPVTDGRYVPVLVKAPRQDLIGGWIQNSEWFPIEINVPDTVSGIGQGVTNAGQGISTALMNFGNGFQSIIQRIPFINRIINQVTPRPMKFVILVPVEEVEKIRKQQISGGGDGTAQFNPFENAVSGFVPVYP